MYGGQVGSMFAGHSMLCPYGTLKQNERVERGAAGVFEKILWCRARGCASILVLKIHRTL